MTFTVNVSKRSRLLLGWLNDDEQFELGQFAVETIAGRVRRGVGVDDQPAPPLQQRYSRAKSRRGLSPLRNLTFSGDMLHDFQVIGTGDALRIGFSDPKQAFKAGVNESRAKMIGVSRFDASQIARKHDELLARAVREMVKVLAA